MTQAKKPVYAMYQMMLSETLRKIKKDFPKANPRHQFGIFFGKNPELASQLGLAFFIFVEENFWEINGRHVIFPDSPAVIDNLMRARYEIDNTNGLTLPFESFVTAMPTCYVSNGHRIPSFLTSFSMTENFEGKLGPFLDSLKVGRETFDLRNNRLEDRLVVVQYKTPSSGLHSRVCVKERSLPSIMRCKTAAEYQSRVLPYTGSLDNGNEDTLENAEIQFFALKFVAAMAIYNAATGGSKLLDGFPGEVMPKLLGHDGSAGMRLSTLHNLASAKNSPDTHYRSWHFRNLKSEKYYKGEHASTPQGSRYVFVSDTVVGKPVAPSTMI
jgi:hypothetical protein